MNELPYLRDVFDRLRRGWHLSPEDEPEFSAVSSQPEAYVEYFKLLGINLVRHPRDFFYFQPEAQDSIPDALPRIAVFSFILIDHAADQGRAIEDFLLNQIFLVSKLPHLASERYSAMMRQVEIDDVGGIRKILNAMKGYGWIKFVGEEEFRILRPFHRVFDKCLELVETAKTPPAAETTANPESSD